ncbi:MAG TPA: hypothetical protein VNN07_01625, partial [Candidatus Tectomicrobia bacterium]|nr:hypothetical protein [Candidatus Tectomicrobia bacterium]
GPAAFGQVKGIVVTDDGRIAVLDAQAQEIRVFAPDGSHLRTFGGKGGGPGEMENANGMLLGPDGLIRVNDPRNARMSFFHPDSGFVRSHPIEVRSWGWIWDGVVDSAGKVWESHSMRLQGEAWTVLRAYDAQGNWTDTIPIQKQEPDARDAPGTYRWEIPNGVRFAAVPFWPGGAIDYDPRGFFWFKGPHRNDYRIVRATPAGDTTLVLESRRPAVPVTAAERDAAIAALREQGARDLDWSQIPAEKPIVRSLFVDEAGRVWVRVTTPDTRTTFDVYLPDGTYDGTATTTLNIPEWWQPLVRGDLFYTLHTDELDVPHVVRARITRAGERVAASRRGTARRRPLPARHVRGPAHAVRRLRARDGVGRVHGRGIRVDHRHAVRAGPEALQRHGPALAVVREVLVRRQRGGSRDRRHRERPRVDDRCGRWRGCGPRADVVTPRRRHRGGTLLA